MKFNIWIFLIGLMSFSSQIFGQETLRYRGFKCFHYNINQGEELEWSDDSLYLCKPLIVFDEANTKRVTIYYSADNIYYFDIYSQNIKEDETGKSYIYNAISFDGNNTEIIFWIPGNQSYMLITFKDKWVYKGHYVNFL